MSSLITPFYVICSSTVTKSGCEYFSLCVNIGKGKGTKYTVKADARTGEECASRKYTNGSKSTCDC